MISILRGGITRDALQDTIDRKARVVLTTYGYSRRAVSLDDMTAIVLASPRRNGLTQILGRVLRRNSDTGVLREVVDIVDWGTKLKSQKDTRAQVYAAKGFPVEIVQVSHDEITLGAVAAAADADAVEADEDAYRDIPSSVLYETAAELIGAAR